MASRRLQSLRGFHDAGCSSPSRGILVRSSPLEPNATFASHRSPPAEPPREGRIQGKPLADGRCRHGACVATMLHLESPRWPTQRRSSRRRPVRVTGCRFGDARANEEIGNPCIPGGAGWLGKRASRRCVPRSRSRSLTARAARETSRARRRRSSRSAQRATGATTCEGSPPLEDGRLPTATAFIGTGAARSGLINSMGMGKTMVEFWFEPMSSSVCM